MTQTLYSGKRLSGPRAQPRNLQATELVLAIRVGQEHLQYIGVHQTDVIIQKLIRPAEEVQV